MLPNRSPDPETSLVGALAGRHAQPLWDRYQRVTRRAPQAADAPMVWRWEDMQPLIDRACAEVEMEDAERRVLLLTHPAFDGRAVTTTNLLAGLQTLLPGETARAHRHALQAIRFVLHGEGAVTRVNGHACPMHAGDLVLTPAWTWHEHVHAGEGRMVWFDGLDLPLSRYLDTMFFELQGVDPDIRTPHPVGTPLAGGEMVLLEPDPPDGAAGDAAAPRFRYAWTRALAALDAAPPRADASRLLRYVDASSGGAVLPTLDCYLLACQRGKPTRRRRSTSNAVCVVARGHGSSRVGEQCLRWRQGDVFTLPHWNWVSHEAQSDDALVFLMTDRELLAGLGYLREEEDAGGAAP